MGVSFVGAALVAAALPATAAPKPRPPAPAAAVSPCATIERIFKRVDALVEEASRRDARSVARLDGIIREYKAPILGQGRAAVPCLSVVALDPVRPLKSRLWALTFASLIKDPATLAPLKAVLADPKAPGELRSAAASYIPLMRGVCGPAREGAPASCFTQDDARRTLCAALEDKTLPEVALRELLSRVSRFGCDDAGPVEAWVKGFGLHPRGKDWENAWLAIQSLARARTRASTRVLLRLFEHYPPGSRGRKLLYKALLDKGDDLRELRETAVPLLTWALKSEPGPSGEVLAIQALAAVKDPATADVFMPYLLKEDPQVVAETAAALAAVGARQAIPALEKLLAGVNKDGRFAATDKRLFPHEFVDRIRAAVDSLWGRK